MTRAPGLILSVADRVTARPRTAGLVTLAIQAGRHGGPVWPQAVTAATLWLGI